VENFISQNIWLVILASGLVGAILRHYIMRDYTVLQKAVQTTTCLQHRRDMERAFQARIMEAESSLKLKLASYETCFGDLKAEVSLLRQEQVSLRQLLITMRQAVGLMALASAAQCQAINTLPGIERPVDCGKLEAISSTLLAMD